MKGLTRALLPILFEDHATAIAVAHTRAVVTGVRQIVRREVTPAWPWGVWRVREVDLADA